MEIVAALKPLVEFWLFLNTTIVLIAIALHWYRKRRMLNYVPLAAMGGAFMLTDVAQQAVQPMVAGLLLITCAFMGFSASAIAMSSLHEEKPLPPDEKADLP